MNPFAFFAVLFGCAAIVIAYVSLVNHERAELLEETLHDHTIATQTLLAHMEALETYCVALESANRYNRAVAAGFMLTVGAVDVGEVLFVLDGETMP